MATAKPVWGIDIGQCALKALKLSHVGGEVQAVAFDIIEHAKILSQPDADRNQLIRNALEQFLARNSVAGCTVAISVPGQTSFTRFVKLPPVEAKRVPDVVKFEAEQQIPFPIGEVIWRWQAFQDPDSPEVEVGIFAMKRADIYSMLDHFIGVAIDADCVQMAPLALCNFMTFDDQVAPDGATLLADVGADKTDLVVSDKSRIWTRTVQIGGNNFTEALVRSFKLSFAKAEKLKRTAATSKYARQIFQAMRPVFADLVQEIQRSVGYYTSLHRETRFKRLVGLGNGFRLPGLQKYLEQNLNIPVVRIDSYNKLSPSATINAPIFTENVLSFAVAYGLALQGLGLTRVNTNLLPVEIARRRLWSKKRPWFAASAAALVLSAAGPLWRAYADRGSMAPSTPALESARQVSEDLTKMVKDYNDLKGKGTQELKQCEAFIRLYGYHNYWPSVYSMISKSISTVATDQPHLDLPASQREKELKEILARHANRQDRQMLFVESISAKYLASVNKIAALTESSAAAAVPGATPAATPAPGAKPPSGKPSAIPNRRGFQIFLTGRTPLSRSAADDKLLRPLLRYSEEFSKTEEGKASPFRVVDYDVTEWLEVKESAERPTGGAPEDANAPRVPDPLFPGEDAIHDTRFVISWVVTIENDGIILPEGKPQDK